MQSSATVDVSGLTSATAAIASAPAAAPAPRTPTASYGKLHPASLYISLIFSHICPARAPTSVPPGPPPFLRSVSLLSHCLPADGSFVVLHGSKTLSSVVDLVFQLVSLLSTAHCHAHLPLTPPNCDIVAVIHTKAHPIQLPPSQPVSLPNT